MLERRIVREANPDRSGVETSYWLWRSKSVHRPCHGDHRSALVPGLPQEIAADAVEHTWTSYSQTLQHVIVAAEATAWLDEIECPVLLVAGDRDPVVDHAHLRRLADAHDNIELAVPRGRHHVPLTHPAECTAAIAMAPNQGWR